MNKDTVYFQNTIEVKYNYERIDQKVIQLKLFIAHNLLQTRYNFYFLIYSKGNSLCDHSQTFIFKYPEVTFIFFSFTRAILVAVEYFFIFLDNIALSQSIKLTNSTLV